MPINEAYLACTTNYQNNCGLNALAHIIIKNITKVPEDAIAELYREFLSYYNLEEKNLSQEYMIDLLKSINNPVRLEVLLGPVLRQMLQTQMLSMHTPDSPMYKDTIGSGLLNAAHVLCLARKFAISVECYEAKDLGNDVIQETREKILKEEAEKNGEVIIIDTLKLFHTGGIHWEYEEGADKVEAHNSHYDSENRMRPKGFQYDAGEHHEKLIKLISEGLKEYDINAVLDHFEGLKEIIMIIGQPKSTSNFYAPPTISKSLKQKYLRKIREGIYSSTYSLIQNGLINAVLRLYEFPRPLSEKLDSLQIAYKIHKTNKLVAPHLLKAIEGYVDDNFVMKFVNLLRDDSNIDNFKADFIIYLCSILNIEMEQEPLVEATIQQGKIYWRVVGVSKEKPLYQQGHDKTFSPGVKTWYMDWDTFRRFKDAGKRSGTVEVTKERFVNEMVKSAPTITSAMAGKVWDELKVCGILNSRNRISHAWRSFISGNKNKKNPELKPKPLTLTSLNPNQFQECIKTLYSITQNELYKVNFNSENVPELIMYRKERSLKYWDNKGIVSNADCKNNAYSTRRWEVGIYTDLKAHRPEKEELDTELDYDHIPSVGKMNLEIDSIEEDREILNQDIINAEIAINAFDGSENEDDKLTVEEQKKIKVEAEEEQKALLQKIDRIKFELSAGKKNGHGELLWAIAIPRKLHKGGGTYMVSKSEQKNSKEHPFLADVGVHLDNLEEKMVKIEIPTNEHIQALGAFRYLYRCLSKEDRATVGDYVAVGVMTRDRFFKKDTDLQKIDEFFYQYIRSAMAIIDRSKHRFESDKEPDNTLKQASDKKDQSNEMKQDQGNQKLRPQYLEGLFADEEYNTVGESEIPFLTKLIDCLEKISRKYSVSQKDQEEFILYWNTLPKDLQSQEMVNLLISCNEDSHATSYSTSVSTSDMITQEFLMKFMETMFPQKLSDKESEKKKIPIKLKKVESCNESSMYQKEHKDEDPDSDFLPQNKSIEVINVITISSNIQMSDSDQTQNSTINQDEHEEDHFLETPTSNTLKKDKRLTLPSPTSEDDVDTIRRQIDFTYLDASESKDSITEESILLEEQKQVEHYSIDEIRTPQNAFKCDKECSSTQKELIAEISKFSRYEYITGHISVGKENHLRGYFNTGDQFNKDKESLSKGSKIPWNKTLLGSPKGESEVKYAIPNPYADIIERATQAVNRLSELKNKSAREYAKRLTTISKPSYLNEINIEAIRQWVDSMEKIILEKKESSEIQSEHRKALFM